MLQPGFELMPVELHGPIDAALLFGTKKTYEFTILVKMLIFVLVSFGLLYLVPNGWSIHITPSRMSPAHKELLSFSNMF